MAQFWRTCRGLSIILLLTALGQVLSQLEESRGWTQELVLSQLEESEKGHKVLADVGDTRISVDTTARKLHAVYDGIHLSVDTTAFEAMQAQEMSSEEEWKLLPSMTREEVEEGYFRMREKRQTHFFDGARDMLEHIVKHSKEKEQKAAPQSVLGFEYLKSKEYKKCAKAFENVADHRSDSAGPRLLAGFCQWMEDGMKVEALASLRRAVKAAKEDLDEERSSIAQQCLDELVKELSGGGEPSTAQKIQRKSAWYVHGLESRPWHDPERLPSAKILEENFRTLQKEVEVFFADGNATLWMRPVDSAVHHLRVLDRGFKGTSARSGVWDEAELFRQGMWNEELCLTLFPETCSLIQHSLPEARTNNFGKIAIARLGPETESRILQGDTNMRLTLHLAFSVPKGAGMKVGDKVREPAWHVGKVTAFDDSFAFQMWNPKPPGIEDTWVVLVIQIWHPEFSPHERADLLEKHGVRKAMSRELSRQMKKMARDLRSPEAEERFELLLSEFQDPSPSSGRGEL